MFDSYSDIVAFVVAFALAEIITERAVFESYNDLIAFLIVFVIVEIIIKLVCRVVWPKIKRMFAND